MNNQSQNYSLIARLTGFILIVVTLTHMAGFQISSTFAVTGDFAATSANVAKGETLFRVAVLSYAASSILSVALAVGFFILIEPINRSAALLVLVWRLFEAIVASGAWAIRFALINNQTSDNLLGPAGAQAFHTALREVANVSFDVSAIGLALATLIGFAALFAAKTLPRVLSAAAIIGALIVMVTSIMTLLGFDSVMSSHLAFAVTLLSQLAIGAWLVGFGAKPPHAQGE